jgi:hypothetical protein
MGFTGKYACYSFTAASIRQNAPQRPGVYALSNAREWIFIGEADDLQAILWAHLRESGTKLRAAGPTGFTFEVCDPAARQTLLARLIADLSPTCNGN